MHNLRQRLLRALLPREIIIEWIVVVRLLSAPDVSVSKGRPEKSKNTETRVLTHFPFEALAKSPPPSKELFSPGRNIGAGFN
jgi:hypothetical protein